MSQRSADATHALDASVRRGLPRIPPSPHSHWELDFGPRSAGWHWQCSRPQQATVWPVWLGRLGIPLEWCRQSGRTVGPVSPSQTTGCLATPGPAASPLCAASVQRRCALAATLFYRCARATWKKDGSTWARQQSRIFHVQGLEIRCCCTPLLPCLVVQQAFYFHCCDSF